MAKPAPFSQLLPRIARSAGTPTYVYFERTQRRRVESLRNALEGVPHRLLYAMKANSHPAILDRFLRLGLGLDAVSPAELLLALRLGFTPEQILFSANNMTDAEMHFAHRQGVLLNIGELSRLNSYGAAYPGAEVCVRLNPEIGAGHHAYVITAGLDSKFGIPVSLADEIKSIIARHGLVLRGLHQHIGSGIPDTEALWEAVSVMIDTAKTFPGISFINIGGGLGIPYRETDEALDLERFGEQFGTRLKGFAEANGIEVWLEPGRFLTAESGVLLVTATTLKDNGDRLFVGVDSGMGHLMRPAIYGAYHEIVNLSNPDGAPRVYDVVGNICESGDRFAQDRTIPEVREGDLLAILDAGAYGYSMGSEYNLRPLPAEVIVDDEDPRRFEVVTERASPAEMVSSLMARSRVPGRK